MAYRQQPPRGSGPGGRSGDNRDSSQAYNPNVPRNSGRGNNPGQGYPHYGGQNGGQNPRQGNNQGPVRFQGTLLTNHYAVKIPTPAPPQAQGHGRNTTRSGKGALGHAFAGLSIAPSTGAGAYTLYRYTIGEFVGIPEINNDSTDDTQTTGSKSELETSDGARITGSATAGVLSGTSTKSPKGGSSYANMLSKKPVTKQTFAKAPTSPSSGPSPSAAMQRTTSDAPRDNDPRPDPEDASKPRTPRSPSLQTRRRLIYLLIQNLKNEASIKDNDIEIASDYSTFLVTCKPLPGNVTSRPHVVVLYGEHEHLRGTKPKYQVELGSSEALPLDGLQDYLRNPGQSTYSGAQWITRRNNTVQALNAIFAHAANLKVFGDVPNGRVKTVARIGSKKFFNLPTDYPPTNLGPWPIEKNAELEARVGFFLSTRTPKGQTAQLLLNINTTTSAFYWHATKSAASVQDTLEDYFKYLWRKEKGLLEISHMLKDLKVQTNYVARQDPTRTERLHTLIGFTAQGKNPKPTACTKTFRPRAPKTLNKDKGSAEKHLLPETTVAAYFRKNFPSSTVYNDSIVADLKGRDDNETIQIPAKLLKVVPGQFYRLKTELVKNAVRPPKDNLELIKNQGKALFGLENNQVPNFGGLSLQPELLRVNAEVLQPPGVRYASTSIDDRDCSKGKWKLDNKLFSKGAGSGIWSYIDIVSAARNSRRASPEALQNFYNNLDNAVRKHGVSCGSHAFWFHNQNRREADLRAHRLEWREGDAVGLQRELGRRVTTLQQSIQGLKLLVVLLPEKKASLYASIKSVCEQKLGIQTVCHVCFSNRRQRNHGPAEAYQTWDNLALKLNLKMSATSVNQQLISDNQLLQGSDTMVMGIDVTHAGAAALKGAPSIAAVVGSVNDDYSQFPAVFSINQREEVEQTTKPANDKRKAKASDSSRIPYGKPKEIIEDLQDMAEKSIRRWMRTHGGRTPSRLIVFRDGLSEEQLDQCRENEIPRLKRAIGELSPPDQVTTQLLVICTVKRHHVRFFPDERPGNSNQDELFPMAGGKPMNNPPPGTLVGNGVTLSDSDQQGDFFLISHDVIGDGTAHPTHYVILANEMGATKQQVALMTHSLCYLFGRSTTSVSLAPPAYYADLAADRARCYARSVYAPETRGGEYAGQPIDLTLHPAIEESMFYI